MQKFKCTLLGAWKREEIFTVYKYHEYHPTETRVYLSSKTRRVCIIVHTYDSSSCAIARNELDIAFYFIHHPNGVYTRKQAVFRQISQVEVYASDPFYSQYLYKLNIDKSEGVYFYKDDNGEHTGNLQHPFEWINSPRFISEITPLTDD